VSADKQKRVAVVLRNRVFPQINLKCVAVVMFNPFVPAEKPEASYWITHGGCLVLLVLINCSNSILVRGVYIDAEEEGGNCVVFPCYYLRLFFQVSDFKTRTNSKFSHNNMAETPTCKAQATLETSPCVVNIN